MFPGGFVYGREKAYESIILGPFISKMKQYTKYGNKKILEKGVGAIVHEVPPFSIVYVFEISFIQCR
jgi:hypothetical protein